MKKKSCAERNGKLFGSKEWTKVLRVDFTIVATSLFRVDVPSSSESVGLLTEFSGTEANSHIELTKVLRPPGLTAGEHLRGGKIFQVLVVSNNIDRGSGTFKVMAPDAESFENREKLFVVNVVVQFRSCKSS